MEEQVLAERYELRGLLGEGGMARVYEGYDRVLARRVAVKLLREDIGGGRATRERMLREARAAASFHHPNAVAVFDTGQEGRTPYIVMELVEGGTLADELASRGSLESRRAVAVADQVLSALAAAHRRGLVHRDVKPANIMLPPGEGAKLADFGIAKGVEEVAGLTLEGQVLGTPKYLSPEQVGGKPATARSDVYAAGVVLYEMLAGEPPFTADNPFAVAVAHQEDTPRRLDRRVKGLEPGLVDVVHRCLEKDPERRFADADALRQALQSLSAGTVPPAAAATTKVLPRRDSTDTVAAPTSSAPDRAAPTGRSARGFGLAAALVVLLALAGVLVFQALDSPPGEEPPDESPDAPVDEPAEPEPGPVPEPGTEPDPPPADPTPPAPPTPTPPPEDPEPAPDPGEPTPAPAPEARSPTDLLPG